MSPRILSRVLTRVACALTAAASLSTSAFAYVRASAPPWAVGTVTLKLMLGDTGFYTDGSTPNGTAAAALNLWNPYMGRVQLAGQAAGLGQGTKGNVVNEVFFAANAYGQAFDTGVLAITLVQYNSTIRSEADVIVNSNDTWDSYRGSLRTADDLRRVLTHEFGHVLGLDHPDEHGQYVTALMNSTISNIETPQTDDQNGVASMYGYGTANTPAPPSIYSNPYNQTVYVGDPVTLQVYANGTGLAYQWRKDGANISGATLSYLSIKSAQLTDAGKYDVIVSNAGGSVTSPQATLTVNAVPPPTIGSQPNDVSTYTTLNTYFSVYSNGVHLKYQWQKDDAPITGATSSSLSLSNLTLTDAGNYSVIVSNEAGSITSREARLTINPLTPPVITADLVPSTIREGQYLTMNVSVSCPTNPTFQWYKDGQPIQGMVYSSYSIFNATDSAAGKYYVVATDAAGSVTSSTVSLTILPMTLPGLGTVNSPTVNLGQQFTLSTGVYNNPYSTQLTYQWYHNGIAVPGETNSQYTRASATYNDAGEYFVAVTNGGGTSISGSGYLTVIPSTSSTGWSITTTYNSIAYFLFTNPARIERFDMNAGTWLASIPVNGLPTAMTVNSHGIFLAISSRIDHLATDGTGQAPWVSNAGGTVQGLASTSSSLAAYVLQSTYSTNLNTYSYSDAHLIATNSAYSYLSPQLISNPDMNLLLSMSTPNISNYDTKVILTAAGGIVNYATAYTYGQPPETFLYLTPDGTLSIASSGTVYSTADMSIKGRIESAIDLAFTANATIACLDDNGITEFDASLNLIGHIPLSTHYIHISAFGKRLFAFNPSTTQGTHPDATEITAALSTTPTTAPTIDPIGLAIQGDNTFVDNSGTLYIYSKAYQTIFRWSPATHSYITPSIPLQGGANYVSYQPALNRIYVGYGDNRINQIRLDLGELYERPFTRTNVTIAGIAPVSSSIFVPSLYNYSTNGGMYLYNSSGIQTSSTSRNTTSTDFIWDSNTNRIYFFDNFQPDYVNFQPITSDGKFANADYTAVASGIKVQPPLRVSPNGAQILLGSGQLIDPVSIKAIGQLPTLVDDGVWLGTTLYTLLSELDGVHIDRWGGANLTSDASAIVAGRAVRMFAEGTNELLLVVTRNGVLHYVLLDQNLKILSDTGPGLTERMIGLSSRASVGTGDNVMVVGFVIDGTTPKHVVVRAVGPGLTQFNIANPLADPQVVIYDAKSNQIAGNDNYGSVANLADLKAAMTRLGLFNLPDGSRDAALLTTLNPGLYTAQVSGVNNGTGVGILEIYDADEAPGSCHMISLSSRAQVGTGDNVLVSGIIVSGTAGKTLLIRGDGPVLSKYNVSNPLAKPRLQLFNGSTLIAQNSGWSSDASQVAALKAAATKTGLFPLDDGSKDAALLIHLDPGIYTAQVDGADGGTGVALLEVYEVPQ